MRLWSVDCQPKSLNRKPNTLIYVGELLNPLTSHSFNIQSNKIHKTKLALSHCTSHNVSSVDLV